MILYTTSVHAKHTLHNINEYQIQLNHFLKSVFLIVTEPYNLGLKLEVPDLTQYLRGLLRCLHHLTHLLSSSYHFNALFHKFVVRIGVVQFTHQVTLDIYTWLSFSLLVTIDCSNTSLGTTQSTATGRPLIGCLLISLRARAAAK